MIEQSLGNLVIVDATTGGGKTSLVKELVKRVKDLEISISHTTRDQRPGEVAGVHYFFVAAKHFLNMVETHQFIEHARVFEHDYGTSRAQIEVRLQAGVDVILDIDWQGASQIKQSFSNAVSIFILPPSITILENRLTNRKRDHAEVIQARMRHAREQMSHYKDFDYLIVNDCFEQALEELTAIITAQRLQLKRQMIKQRKLLSLLLGTK